MGKYVVFETATGWKFDLKAVNGEAIATSEVYTSREATVDVLEMIRKIAPKAHLEDQTRRRVDVKNNPKFEVFLDQKGAFRFRLKNRQGDLVLFSEGYTTKASCFNGIESVRRNAKVSPVY